jgi:WD40 repeat protein
VRDLGIAASEIANVGFSGDGSRLMALNRSGTTRIWSRDTWSLVAETSFDAAHAAGHGLPRDTTAVAASLNGDGTLLAIGDSQGWVHVLQLSTGTWLCRRVSRYSEQVDAVFEPSGPWLATTGALWDMQLWNTSQLFATRFMPPLHEKPVRPHEKHVFLTRFSRDGRWLATSSLDGTARIWDANTLTLVRELTGHDDAVNSVAFSPDPDASRVATASWDRKVRVFDRVTGMLQLLMSHEYPVRVVLFSEDGTRLVTSSVMDVRPEIDLLDEAELSEYAHKRALRALTEKECEELLHHACPPAAAPSTRR